MRLSWVARGTYVQSHCSIRPWQTSEVSYGHTHARHAFEQRRCTPAAYSRRVRASGSFPCRQSARCRCSHSHCCRGNGTPSSCCSCLGPSTAPAARSAAFASSSAVLAASSSSSSSTAAADEDELPRDCGRGFSRLDGADDAASALTATCMRPPSSCSHARSLSLSSVHSNRNSIACTGKPRQNRTGAPISSPTSALSHPGHPPPSVMTTWLDRRTA